MNKEHVDRFVSRCKVIFFRFLSLLLGLCTGFYLVISPLEGDISVQQFEAILEKIWSEPQSLMVIIGLPIVLVLWIFRTYDVREQIQKTQEQIHSSSYYNALAMFSEESQDALAQRRTLGFKCLMQLRNTDKVFVDEIDNITPHAHLNGAQLSKANLRRANLHNANFNNANLNGALLDDANLQGAALSGADLSNANLRSSILNGANLSNTNLNEADLSSAQLSSVNLSGADLSGANLQGANLNEADLNSTKFQKSTRLGGADLSNANLQGVNLSGVDLTNVNLENANLDGADLGNPDH